MKKHIFLISISFAIAAIAIFVYKKSSSALIDEKRICIVSSIAPGIQDDIGFIKQALRLYDIKNNQIVDGTNSKCESSNIKIFLEQKKFDAAINSEDQSLKIGVKLHNTLEEDHPRTIGLFEDDNAESLIELIETILKKPVSFLVVYDENNEHSKRLALQYQEISKIKEIPLVLCTISAQRNISTVLKELDKNINAVIFVPSDLVFKDAEIILEHFKANRVPVFSNHAGLVRAGALGGYDFDSQEIAHAVAEVASEFLKNASVHEDILDELYPQLHLNMDTIKHLGLELDTDLLDEAVTVGRADL